jgi:hypothetical protein
MAAVRNVRCHCRLFCKGKRLRVLLSKQIAVVHLYHCLGNILFHQHWRIEATILPLPLGGELWSLQLPVHFQAA